MFGIVKKLINNCHSPKKRSSPSSTPLMSVAEMEAALPRPPPAINNSIYTQKSSAEAFKKIARSGDIQQIHGAYFFGRLFPSERALLVEAAEKIGGDAACQFFADALTLIYRTLKLIEILKKYDPIALSPEKRAQLYRAYKQMYKGSREHVQQEVAFFGIAWLRPEGGIEDLKIGLTRNSKEACDGLIRWSEKPEAQQALINALVETRDPIIQSKILEFLKDTRSPEYEHCIDRLLTNRSQTGRNYAVNALQEMGDRGVEKLTALLKDRDSEFRRLVVKTLHMMKAQRATPALVDLFFSMKGHHGVCHYEQCEVLKAIKDLGNFQSGWALLEMLRPQDTGSVNTCGFNDEAEIGGNVGIVLAEVSAELCGAHALGVFLDYALQYKAIARSSVAGATLVLRSKAHEIQVGDLQKAAMLPDITWIGFDTDVYSNATIRDTLSCSEIRSLALQELQRRIR